MTPCSQGEYTCNTGHCIEKMKRCNIAIDCPDQSDELDCDVVDVPHGYNPTLPPPKTSGKPLSLAFSFHIIAIKEFNLVGFTVVLDAVVSLRWRDSRLTYRNLRPDYHVNEVRKEGELWKPQLLIRDGARSTVNVKVHSDDVYAMAEVASLPDDVTILSEGNARSYNGYSYYYCRFVYYS